MPTVDTCGGGSRILRAKRDRRASLLLSDLASLLPRCDGMTASTGDRQSRLRTRTSGFVGARVEQRPIGATETVEADEIRELDAGLSEAPIAEVSGQPTRALIDEGQVRRT